MEEGDFTKARSMVFPRQVLVGHGVIEMVPQVCKDFALTGPALIVAGEKTAKAAGDVIADGMRSSGYDVHTIVIGDATETNLKKVEQVASEAKAKILLGVGGGSKIDLAKMTAKD